MGLEVESVKFLLPLQVKCRLLTNFLSAGFPNLQFMEAMEKEHRSKARFMTPNYGISTSAAEEWRIVTECDLSFERDHNGQRRRIPNYSKLLKVDQNKAEGQRAGLTQEEIIAIILYTGPMVRGLNSSVRSESVGLEAADLVMRSMSCTTWSSVAGQRTSSRR